MTPELRGISRMTNVVSPLEKLGQLTADADRLRRSPLLRAARWVRVTVESSDRASYYRAEAKSVAPSFFSAAIAVLLVTGAASALSPIGSDLGGDTGAGVRVKTAKAADVIVEPSALVRVSADLKATEVEQPPAVTYAAATTADTVSPVEQLALTFASASAVKGSRLEPTAVALTRADDAATRPLLVLAEYQAEPEALEPLYTAVLSRLPQGSRVSKGIQVGKGEWVLALDDIGGVEISVPTSTKRAALARIEVAKQNGVILARFPLAIDPQGRIDTETVAAVAVMKDTGLPPPPTKMARLDPLPPQPVLAKPAPKQKTQTPTTQAQKDAVAATTAPQQKRKVVAMRPAPIIKPTTTVNIPIDPADDTEAIAAAPVGIMPEGSAGLETFRSFSLLGGEPPPRP